MVTDHPRATSLASLLNADTDLSPSATSLDTLSAPPIVTWIPNEVKHFVKPQYLPPDDPTIQPNGVTVPTPSDKSIGPVELRIPALAPTQPEARAATTDREPSESRSIRGRDLRPRTRMAKLDLMSGPLLTRTSIHKYTASTKPSSNSNKSTSSEKEKPVRTRSRVHEVPMTPVNTPTTSMGFVVPAEDSFSPSNLVAMSKNPSATAVETPARHHQIPTNKSSDSSYATPRKGRHEAILTETRRPIQGSTTNITNSFGDLHFVHSYATPYSGAGSSPVLPVSIAHSGRPWSTFQPFQPFQTAQDFPTLTSPVRTDSFRWQ